MWPRMQTPPMRLHDDSIRQEIDSMRDVVAHEPGGIYGPVNRSREQARRVRQMARKRAARAKRLIEVYPASWRRWCDSPENGGCACTGCVRWPAPSTVRGDPEGQPFPNPDDMLTRDEVEVYLAARAEGT